MPKSPLEPSESKPDTPLDDPAEPESSFVRRLRPALVRRLFGRASPLAPLLLSIATLLFVVELSIAYRYRLNPIPFALCVFGFLILICFALTRSAEASLRISRVLTVLSLLKVLCLFVAVTGGVSSPYLGILYLPVFLTCLYYGMRGGLFSTAAVCLYLYILTVWSAGGPRAISPTSPLLTQCSVFALVSVSAALFAERMRRTAFAANRRATRQAGLVKQVEWFTDTGVMLQSLDDLEIILAVALMRIDDLITVDSAAIYLRDAELPVLTLTQTKGVANRRGLLQSVSLESLEAMREPEFEALLVRDTSVAAQVAFHTPLSTFDPSARSVIVAPLKTFDDLFGVICVGCGEVDGFRAKHRDRLAQLARHIVYPIQRVRLETIATTDSLTGLNNSRAFRTRLRDEVGRAIRYGHPLSLILIDIDHFKQVNDNLGHRAGDAILTQIGAILRRSSRGIDFAARYGGEELAILCPESADRDAAQLAERIRSTVAETEFELPEGGTTRITVSAGVAMVSKEIETDSALVESSDRALYRAKAGGRDRVEMSGG